MKSDFLDIGVRYTGPSVDVSSCWLPGLSEILRVETSEFLYRERFLAMLGMTIKYLSCHLDSVRDLGIAVALKRARG